MRRFVTTALAVLLIGGTTAVSIGAGVLTDVGNAASAQYRPGKGCTDTNHTHSNQDQCKNGGDGDGDTEGLGDID